MSPTPSNKSMNFNSKEFDLGRIFGELIDHYKLIICISSIVTISAIIYALFATPVYQADALIQIEQKQGNAILNSLSQVLPDTQPQSAPEIALMQSRMILDKTIKELNLQVIITPDYFPIFGRGWQRILNKPPRILKVSRMYLPAENGSDPKIKLFVIDNNTYRIKTKTIDILGHVGIPIEKENIIINVDSIDSPPGTSFTLKYQTRLEAVQNLLKILSITDIGKDTGMLNLSITGEDYSLISQILNSISKSYVEQNIARQAAQDAKSLEFLQQQLPKVRQELDLAENKLNLYRRQKDSVDLTMEAQSVLSQIVNVDNQLNGLTFREAEISQLYTKEHPTYKALLEKRKTLEDERDKLNLKVNMMPATQQEVVRLSRDVDSGQQVYMQLLTRQQELNIAKASAIGNARIVDEAVTEPKPVKPNKILVVLAGAIIGLFISILLVISKVILRRGIESAEQLEDLGVSVYASVPESEWLIKNAKKNIRRSKSYSDNSNHPEQLLSISNPTDLAIEAIRGLRTSLHFAMMEARNNILMISGSSPGSGKSFIASNLSAVISSTGKKVIFIDADMRRGYLNKVLGIENNNGLSEYLSGKTSISGMIKKVSKADFDFIPRGNVPSNPAELLMTSRLAELLKWASENYDLVVVDSPPILAVTDAAIIGNHVGTTLLVVKYEENTTKEVEVSIKRFQRSGVNVKGCILNRVMRRSSAYYSYGYHQYGYTYLNKE
ncbi:polysaccharide biosynthesis tyrosine autokinase [Rahnella sp. L72c]|uniref:Polysaccharide biosynthesis tyrosine autokinase n=1 Tax=Rahnella perminowiae TaxID=2816244 RepID=A0ABS6L8G3_9GAMM|nr:polysaccharide biosynthesis tyrosine autokinase [Rahnella perminowiae]MBU9838119.1 polysaccharide biosynthesis tyrosine autokinase [Rahnella perminowiae]